MAADHLSKRSKGSNVIRHTSWESQKAKKKKYSHYDLNMRSNISLEWDDKNGHVVPKKEQIGISLRELTQFLPVVSNSQNALGDVFSAPTELFELDNLTSLLSYEVWQNHLSVQEREFLTQFLPEGAEPNNIVHELLAGNNFYFGNPFSKWGSSICSGHYHPDAVLRQEECNKANKIAYYSELQKYHTKMIGGLQAWKEKWESCGNPETDFFQKIQRSKKDFHKSGSSLENNIRYNLEDNVGATSDSCSWDADDKSYSSNSPDLKIMNEETTVRVDSSGGGRSVTRPRKGDKVNRRNIENGDGAKYMSYIKVSKEQHQRVKNSMKNSNTSIQPRSLNHVLGNLDSFCVQPYEVFEEEEKQKLHDHWLHLAKTDLPAGFENWKSWRSARWQVIKSLRVELEEKFIQSVVEENEETYNANLDNEEQNGDEETNNQLVITPESDLNASNHETTMQVDNSDESSEESDQILIHNSSQNFCPMTIDANNGVLTESDALPSNLGPYPENLNHSDATEIWPAVTLPNTYYHQPTSVSHGYNSINELSLPQNQSEMHQKDHLRNYLNRRSDSGDSFYYQYPNLDRNELLLHSLFKDPGSSYLHEQKLSRLSFPPTGTDASQTLLGTGQYPRNIQENIFSLPRQEHLLPMNHVPDWSGNNVVNINMPIPLPMPMSAPAHHSGHVASQWFPDDEVVRDGWSGGVLPNQVVTDESLYSVLSQCNGLHSEQFIPNYGGLGRGLVASTTAAAVPPPRAARVAAGVNYVNGGESQPGSRNNGLNWINLPRALHETRPWNDDAL